MLKLIAIALLTLASNTWAGSYYSCTDANGKKSFQAMPCGGQSESKKHEYESYEPPAQQTSYSPSAKSPSELADDLFRDNKIRQLDRDITKSERKLDQQTKSMQQELNALRSKKLRANNNMAGAQWETSISEEMNSVTTKYQTLLENERQNLSRLRDERAALN
jgi:predicted RNase H-like nuclease (RuvC/YqgF family)